MKEPNAASPELYMLSLEDSVLDFRMMCMQLTNTGFHFQIDRVESKVEFEKSIRKNSYDILLIDFSIPGFGAFEALRMRNRICPKTPFICVSGSIGEDLAIELLRMGADDYVIKDRPERLPFAIMRALNESKEKKTLKIAEKSLLKLEEKFRRSILKTNLEIFNQGIREQLKTAELLLANNKADESDHLKSSFLTIFSHEIRTPMNGIMGFTELLKQPGLTSDCQLDYINVIQKSGMRLLNTLNDIMVLSKIESGDLDIQLTVTNINGLIKNTLTIFREEMEQKGLQSSIQLSLAENESNILTDSAKIDTIFCKLIKNAIKFTQSGCIEFGYKIQNASSSNVDFDSATSEMLFFVKDTGIGICSDQQRMIFERFRQGNELLSRGYEGSGLGLSIAKAYVEVLGGNIWVDSVEGKGSAFYFTIPFLRSDISDESHKKI